MINIYTLGKPCSGKTSISHMMELEYGMVHLKVGKIAFQYVNDTYGMDSQQMLDFNQGCIIDIEAISALVNAKVQQYNKNQISIVIDGFPRTMEQFIQYKKFFTSADIFVLLDVTDQTVFQRSNLRMECSKCTLTQTKEHEACVECGGSLIIRSDEDSIAPRLQVFRDYTQDVVDEINKTGKLHVIDGNSLSREAIFEEIRNIIK